MNKRFILVILISIVSVLLVGWVALGNADRSRPVDMTPPETATTSPATTSTRAVNLYAYSPQADMDESGSIRCSQAGIKPVQRSLPESDTIIEDTVRQLLADDLTRSERRQGLTTEFPLNGLTLVGVHVEDGVATVALDDSNHQTSGGACRVTILRAQMEATVRQFPSVAEVHFLPETLFQP